MTCCQYTMKYSNELKVTFPAKSCNEALARMTAAAFAAQLDPSAAEIIDIKTAVSEAVTNCIVHAYREKPGRVEMLCRITDGNVLCIKISDRGCGIPDIPKAMEPLFTTAQGEDRAGLGFAVMESFMDSVRVSSTVGRGTSVTMKKKISARELYSAVSARAERFEDNCNDQ